MSKEVYSFVNYFDSFIYLYEIFPPNVALFFSELIAIYSVLIGPTTVEIWALEGCSVVLVLKHLGFHLHGGAEFCDRISRERNDSCGLEQSLIMMGRVIGKDRHPM